MVVEVRNNNIDKALRILKKKLQDDGFFNELRKREYYMSKGEKRRLSKAAGKRRVQKENEKKLEELGFQKDELDMQLKDHENPTKTNTPLKHQYPLGWYIKWISSIILIVGMIFTANNVYPLNLFFHIIGLSGWLWVSIIWNDRALIVVNAVAVVIFVNGIVAYFLKTG